MQRAETPGRVVLLWSLAACLVAGSGDALGQSPAAERWQPLRGDNLHDPASPAIGVLQEPREALSLLPSDIAGNKVDWVRALREGYIAPRAKVLEDTAVKVLDSQVVMTNTGEMPLVVFPHLPHTEWLDCSNCHEEIFKSQAGATPVNMFEILQGRYCGRCHGAVAFPLTECKRCHSMPRNALKRR